MEVLDHVVVKYHNSKMLLTVDLLFLMQCLFESFGKKVEVRFVAMNEEERRSTLNRVDGINLVEERFWLFKVVDGRVARLAQLERRVIDYGQK